MLGSFVALAGALLLVLLAFAIAFVLAMRAGAPWAIDSVRWLSRTVFNPRQMRTAGTPGAYAGVIRHRGRVSGRSYETPVGIVPAGDSFLVALPYGLRTSWARNVLAAGSATIVHEGASYDVIEPEVVPMNTVMEHFSPSDQRGFRLLRVDRCLRLQRAAIEAAAA